MLPLVIPEDAGTLGVLRLLLASSFDVSDWRDGRLRFVLSPVKKNKGSTFQYILPAALALPAADEVRLFDSL